MEPYYSTLEEAAADLDICGYRGKWAKALEAHPNDPTAARRHFLELGGEYLPAGAKHCADCQNVLSGAVGNVDTTPAGITGQLVANDKPSIQLETLVGHDVSGQPLYQGSRVAVAYGGKLRKGTLGLLSMLAVTFDEATETGVASTNSHHQDPQQWLKGIAARRLATIGGELPSRFQIGDDVAVPCDGEVRRGTVKYVGFDEAKVQYDVEVPGWGVWTGTSEFVFAATRVTW